MAVDRAALARWIGGVEGDAAEQSQLDGLLAAAVAIVEKYAPGAPDAVKDQATLRAAAMMYYHRGPGTEGRVRRVNVLADSGAKPLLAPWRKPSHATAGGS